MIRWVALTSGGSYIRRRVSDNIEGLWMLENRQKVVVYTPFHILVWLKNIWRYDRREHKLTCAIRPNHSQYNHCAVKDTKRQGTSLNLES